MLKITPTAFIFAFSLMLASGAWAQEPATNTTESEGVTAIFEDPRKKAETRCIDNGGTYSEKAGCNWPTIELSAFDTILATAFGADVVETFVGNVCRSSAGGQRAIKSAIVENNENVAVTSQVSEIGRTHFAQPEKLWAAYATNKADVVAAIELLDDQDFAVCIGELASAAMSFAAVGDPVIQADFTALLRSERKHTRTQAERSKIYSALKTLRMAQPILQEGEEATPAQLEQAAEIENLNDDLEVADQRKEQAKWGMWSMDARFERTVATQSWAVDVDHVKFGLRRHREGDDDLVDTYTRIVVDLRMTLGGAVPPIFEEMLTANE